MNGRRGVLSPDEVRLDVNVSYEAHQHLVQDCRYRDPKHDSYQEHHCKDVDYYCVRQYACHVLLLVYQRLRYEVFLFIWPNKFVCFKLVQVSLAKIQADIVLLYQLLGILVLLLHQILLLHSKVGSIHAAVN